MTKAPWKIKAYHIISIALIVASLAFAVFRFAPVALRVWQALKDFIFSLGYYGTKTIHNFGWINASSVVVPTVDEIPEGLEELLPFELERFVELFELFISRCFDITYFKRFSVVAANNVAKGAEVLLLLFLPMVFVIIALVIVYSIENTDHNKDTGPLKIYRKFEKKVWYRIKAFVKKYLEFVKERWYYNVSIFLIWAWNFSVITIFFELFAWLFYFCVSHDFVSLYAQLVKLIADLSVPALFLPGWVWFIIGLKVFDVIRKDIGKATLHAKEAIVRAFLELYSWSILIVGKQRAKKSTLLALFKRMLERIFRDVAQDKFFQRDMQFPNFPWIYVELMVKKGQSSKLSTLEKCRTFTRELRGFFENRNKYTEAQKRQILRHLRKRYGYMCNDFIFEYDYQAYGLNYNAGTTIVNIFDALEKYTQLYKIYQNPSTLDIGNISVREDITWDDKGNFPLKEDDFFDKKPENIKKDSQYSHRMNYDAFRPGRVFDEGNPENNAVEYAIGVMDEADKERKNMLTKRGLKAGSDLANQENDLFETDTKMRPGHAALVDNYPFFRWLMASQRSGSLGADNRDMTVELYIKMVSEAKLAMPGFAFEEAAYLLSTPMLKKVYYAFRNLRGDNTLFMYFLKKLYSLIFNHYWRIFNQYAYYVATVRVSDSQDGEVLEKACKIPIPIWIVYAEVFASDSYNGYYSAKAKRSDIGLNNIPMYKGVRPTLEELQEQNSYFIEDISATFGVQRRRAAQAEETSIENKKVG